MAFALQHARLHATRGLSHTRVLGDPAVTLTVLRHILDN